MQKKFITTRLVQMTSIALLLFFLIGCKKTGAFTLSGTLESVQYDINAEASGKIIQVLKDEGDFITAGEVLAVIDSAMTELAVRQQEALVRLKQARLEEIQAGSRPEQIKQGEASIDTAIASVSAAETNLETAQITYAYWNEKYKQLKTLESSNAAAENDVSDVKLKLDTSAQQLTLAEKHLQSSKSQLKSSEAQLELLKNGNTSPMIRAAQADLDQTMVALDQAKLSLSRCRIISPVSGVYLYKNVMPGDMINIGTSIGVISDESSLWTYLYLPQRHLNLISRNNVIHLTCTAVPEKVLTGKVVHISDKAEFTPKNIETDESKENTVFKVKVEIDDISGLKPGMSVHATIPLN